MKEKILDLNRRGHSRREISRMLGITTYRVRNAIDGVETFKSPGKRAKLTTEQAIFVLESDKSCGQLAIKFGVSKNVIHNVRIGRSHTYLSLP